MKEKSLVRGCKWEIGPFFESKSSFLKFLDKKYCTVLSSSERLSGASVFPDTQKVLDRIDKALKNKERIIIFGDFDADGITSTALLVSSLKEIGALVSFRIPERINDSHGLKNRHIDELLDKEIGLIITCDCGINDKEQVEYATKNGIDVIITDHHEPDKDFFPKAAIGILNPKLVDEKDAYQYLAGAGVAFFLACELVKKYFPKEKHEWFILKYSELAAIGTIADCMPLLEENKKIVQMGLQSLKNTKWPAFKTWFEFLKIDLQSINE